jgi:hypothetical protein
MLPDDFHDAVKAEIDEDLHAKSSRCVNIWHEKCPTDRSGTNGRLLRREANGVTTAVKNLARQRDASRWLEKRTEFS